MAKVIYVLMTLPAAPDLLPLLLLLCELIVHVLLDDGAVRLNNVVHSVLAEGKDLLRVPARG